MQEALAEARTFGAEVFGGARIDEKQKPVAYYVTPALAEMPAQTRAGAARDVRCRFSTS